MTDANIFALIDGLPPRIKELHDRTFTMVFEADDVRLQSIDSAGFMLSILELSNQFEAVAWLQSIGITDGRVKRIMLEHFGRRPSPATRKDKWDASHDVEEIAQYTAAAKRMFIQLSTLDRSARATNTMYVAKTLEAIVLSGSYTVERIFQSAGLSMDDVKHVLNIKSPVH